VFASFFVAHATIALNFIKFMLCSRTSLGVVTKERVEQQCAIFPCDRLLYLPKLMYLTCQPQKPAWGNSAATTSAMSR